MALVDDLDITFRAVDGGFLGRADLSGTTLGTFYAVRDVYSLVQDLADEVGGTALQGFMAYPNPISAQTPTDFTIENGWYLTQGSYNRLRGGAIQTSGYDGEIYTLTMASSGYTNAISTDIGKIVTGGTSGATGYLLDYNNTSREWRVRAVSDTFVDNEACTIGSGTGAGTTLSSDGVKTGEDGAANPFTVGTVNHEGTYIVQSGAVLDDSDWYESSNISGNHVDVLVHVRRWGSLIASGVLLFFNRVNRDAANALDGATTGDTYDWAEGDFSAINRQPVVLNTRPDPVDTLTNAQAEDYLDGTTSTIAIATAGAPYSADINQDGTNEAYAGQIDADSQVNEVLWSALAKYAFRKGASTNVPGTSTPYEQFRSLDVANYAITKESPIGTIAGGSISFARGWYPINVAAVDASSYTTIGTGATDVISPPTFFVRAVTGLTSGQNVIYARRSAPNFVLVNEFTLASGNDSGDGTLVIAETIPVDKPSTGTVRVIRNDGQTEDKYAYTSYSGSTFTLSGTLAVTYASGNSAYVPYIDEVATSSSISKSLRYPGVDRDCVLNVRLGSGAGKIEPFPSNFTITNADSSIPAAPTPDTINNN